MESRSVKKRKSNRKRKLKRWKELKFGGKVWRFLWVGVLAVWGFTIFQVLFCWVFNPPLTPLMIHRFFQQLTDSERAVRFERDYVPIEEISPNMVTAVVYSEDGLFMYHHGFDVKMLKQSYRENQRGRRVRGGSTISMQTAKNAFLPHHRSMVRKAAEAYYTLLIEKLWGKKRIMEVYLNIIEFGDGIYGVEAASQHYFGHSAKNLSKREAAMLAVSLPNPMKINAEKNGPYFRRQTGVVMGRMGWGRVNLDMPKEKREHSRHGKQETLWDFIKWMIEQKKK